MKGENKTEEYKKKNYEKLVCSIAVSGRFAHT